MPRRNLTATKFWVHPRRKPDEVIHLDAIPDSDKALHDYLFMFNGFAQEVTSAHLQDTGKEQWTSVIDISYQLGRTLLIATESGKYGENGVGVNIHTGDTEFNYDSGHSIQVTTHGMLIVPKGARYGLLFQERSNGRCGAGRVHDVFIEAFKKKFPDLIVKTAPFLESEAWLEAAALMEIEVEITKPSKDEADFDIPGLSNATYSYNISPSPGQKSLPRQLYDQLFGKDIRPGQLVSLSRGEETGKVFVTLAKDGRRKSFELHNENSPVASILLSDHGESALSAAFIKSRCLEEATDYFSRMGIEWREQFANGKWRPEDLKVRTVRPNVEET